MRVMTFNLRADTILDRKNRWKTRARLVYDTLKKYDCDIIGVQEVTMTMYDNILQNIKDYQLIGSGRTKKYFHEKNNLMVKGKYHILSNDTFWLSRTPEKMGSSIWYSMFPRICTTALIEVEDNKKIRVYNTHLDCLLPWARSYGLKKIGEQIEKHYQEEKLPCILMGDFNATPNSKVMKQFSRGVFTSRKFVAVQEVDTSLYDRSTMSMFRGKEKGMHIDYIFVSEEITICDVQIVRDNENGKYPSDHYPIVAEIEIG